MVVAVCVAASSLPRLHALVQGNHLANAGNADTVREGAALYATNCASCHGRHLEGQPLWQIADSQSWRRAPAQDATGHSWRHSDEDLFALTKYGRLPAPPGQPRPAMPGFGNTLSDRHILAVIAFIKSRWPTSLRVAQSMLNDSPLHVPFDTAWRFPPTCRPAD